MSIKYELRYRNNIDGKPCTAPFFEINGTWWNVWDIPNHNYSEEVEKAIKHAYELGYMKCKQDVQNVFE